MASNCVVCFVCVALVIFTKTHSAYESVESNGSTISLDTNISLACVFNWNPCSLTIIGNLILVAFYGILLGFSAKMISDGAEMLLDLGLPPAIIGGVLLPLLGAIPDSAMIIFSGATGTREDANKEISVGMG